MSGIERGAKRRGWVHLFVLACLLVAVTRPGIATAQFVLPVIASTSEVEGTTWLSTASSWPNSCTPLGWRVVRTGNTIDVYVIPFPTVPVVFCDQSFTGWQAQVSLGALPRQPFTINIYNWCCDGPPLLAQQLQILPSGIGPSFAQSVPAIDRLGALLLALLVLVCAVRYRPAP